MRGFNNYSMMAILFMVGKRLEDPTIVNQLLDVSSKEGRPTYLMASEIPLCLVDSEYIVPLSWRTESNPLVKKGMAISL